MFLRACRPQSWISAGLQKLVSINTVRRPGRSMRKASLKRTIATFALDLRRAKHKIRQIREASRVISKAELTEFRIAVARKCGLIAQPIQVMKVMRRRSGLKCLRWAKDETIGETNGPTCTEDASGTLILPDRLVNKENEFFRQLFPTQATHLRKIASIALAK